MSTSLIYDSKTRKIEREEDPRDKRYTIYVWGEEGDGYLTLVKFGGRFKVTICDDPDPKKAKRMTESKALGLLTQLDDLGIRANLFCFPSVVVYR